MSPVLSRYWDDPRSWTLETYRRNDGYRALDKALRMDPDQVIGTVKDSGLRGRGGAGFPTGTKWGFIPQSQETGGPAAKPHFLVVNADESEPGTCKDMPLILATPHALVEGVIIAAYAIRSSRAFIYLRGEVVPVLRRLQAAVAEAYEAGYLGRDILGSGYDLELVVHAGAGAYICGEETALLDSLEGRRGQPRLRPPFPAVAGLYASPTVVNNVESIASVPPIILRGPQWFRSMGSMESPGFTLYSLSGHVARPGQYEAPLGITLRELLEYSGGVRAGHSLKFWTPGGSSTPLFTADHLDVPLDYEHVAAAGSMLGTKALQIFDETTCVVRAVLRWTEFYEHESCGKCTPAARAPTGWSRSSSAWRRATAPRRTWRSCSTSPTASSGSPSAPSATARPARSSPPSSTFVTSTWRISSSAGARSIRTGPLSIREDTSDDGEHEQRRDGSAHPRGARVGHHRRRPDRGSQGNSCDPRRGDDRHPDPPVLRPSATRPGRRLPPVSGRRRGPAQAARVVHHDRHGRHGGPHPAHLARRGQGAAGRDGTVADQSSARLPGLRQGRRMPAAEPGDVQRPDRITVRRGQTHLPQTDSAVLRGPARPGAVCAVRPVHPLLPADRGRPVHRVVGARRASAGRHLRQGTVRVLLLGQHCADLPGRRADRCRLPVPRPAVRPGVQPERL
ncbi:NADH-ubiquinone oxidoreductase-F iron-sulfur binding region family protein [Rhodococcus sp. MTM3W5.2]|nr:NADH-ubiquinone oxidoreductase-F iron-sulfur binding region family protein [Rhodococcus sp. MTM3W5.2]